MSREHRENVEKVYLQNHERFWESTLQNVRPKSKTLIDAFWKNVRKSKKNAKKLKKVKKTVDFPLER